MSRAFPLAALGLAALGLAACGPPIEPITECPDGAQVVGEAPPDGYTQRCQKGEVRHGLSRSWFENGQVRVQREWWENELHGPFTLWYEDGQLRARGAHHHNEPTGEWTYWDEDGTVAQQRDFGAPGDETEGDGEGEAAPGGDAEPDPEPDPDTGEPEDEAPGELEGAVEAQGPAI